MKLYSRQFAIFVIATVAASSLDVLAQHDQYQDYGDDQEDYYQYAQQEDGLYHDHQNRQKGGGMGKTIAFTAVGWMVGGKIHSKRAVKKANKKATKDLKDLYTKYIQDVTTLQSQNAELEAYIKQAGREQLKEEFIRADVDNDRKVSRAEFERYKRDYLASHPEMAPSQFPRFEDFDPDSNGMITMSEHDQYYTKRGY